MASLKEVRTRIASVSSTQQVTSAMKMVSAAKFRRAQMAIMGMRPYAAQLNDIISDINVDDGVQTPYHEVRKLDKVLLVVVTSNKGLCGAFNSNVIKQASARIEYYREEQKVQQISLITIGRRASEFFAKTPGLVESSHDDLLDKTTFKVMARKYRKFVYDENQRFIYPTSDWGFKFLLGSEENKDILKRGLSAACSNKLSNKVLSSFIILHF